MFAEPVVAKLTTKTKHTIRLKEGARPYQKAPYRLAVDQREALEQEIKEFRRKGWVRPLQSEWATVPLVVPKKDGKPRVCIDYRDLNAIVELDAYPLPKIDELLNRLAKARWFTKMDLCSGYHQIPMEENSIKLTAFRLSPPVEGCSLYEWVVMPMGLAAAPATFQRWMDEALRGLEEKVLVYLDDVLIHSAEQAQHEVDVKEVLQRLRERGMKAKKSKCQFAQESMAFLGHVVTDGQIAIDPQKLQRLAEWEPPLQTIRQVRQLLGFLSYYRAFIPRFAEITAPLSDLLRKTKQMTWTEEATEAMKEAKRALCEACKRYAWDQEREDRVTTDASGVGIAATFEQKVPGVGWAPTAFWSRKLSEAERRYSTTDQEWLAVVESVTRQWRHWLRGRKFILRSDHGALKEFLTKKGENFSNRQYRWFDRLNDFVFEFQHLAGNLNAAADALSRNPAFFVSALEVRHEQRRLMDLGWEEIVKAAEKDWGYQQWLSTVQESGLQKKQGVAIDVRGRIVVPNDGALRTKIILEAHETPFCGHMGKKRTEEQVERVWRWEAIKKDVDRVIDACDVCQKSAGKTRKQEAPLTTIIATSPWELVTMDFMSGMEPSVPGGWKGCAVVCDRFSRMMHVRECPTHPTAQEAARLFLQMVVRAHGIPSKILTDRGTQFESQLWHEVMKLMGTRIALASTHHPQTNGLTERMNRTLIAMIRKVCNQEKGKWVEMLPLMEFAYNNSRHSATGVTPFQAIQGTNPVVPAALVVPMDRTGVSPKSYATEIASRLQRIHQTMRSTEEQTNATTKRREDSKRGRPKFQEGEEVLCHYFPQAFGHAQGKQQFTYHGPYVVRKVHDSGAAVELMGLPAGMPVTINVEHLRKYRRDEEAGELTRQPPPPEAERDEEGELVWEVERVLGHRWRANRLEYQIKWKGYPEPTWNPRKDLGGSEEMLKEYWEQRGRAPPRSPAPEQQLRRSQRQGRGRL